MYNRRVALKVLSFFNKVKAPVGALSKHCETWRSPVDSSISHRSSLAAGPLHTDCVTIVQS